MLRQSVTLLRRGKQPLGISSLPSVYRFVPNAHKPHQGGQYLFQQNMLKTRDDDLRLEQQQRTRAMQNSGAMGTQTAQSEDDGIPIVSPAGGFSSHRGATDDVIQSELQSLIAHDEFINGRGFNDAQWYAEETQQKVNARLQEQGTDISGIERMRAEARAPDGTLLPQRVVDNAYFRNQFEYDLVKDSKMPVSMEYGQLDMWAELPQYSRDMYFVYIISRRRNTYAVCYDYDGYRLLSPYSVGNRGLKGGDKGFRSEGSAEVAHQVTSMYLNDLIPKIRDHAVSKGRPLGKTDKVDVVLRVLGFFNGRAGGVRALNDRSDFFTVRYFEDITPMPTVNGPRMPRAVHR